MRYSIIALAVATGITASPAFADNLITNGDFTNLTKGVGQITTDTGQGLSNTITSAVGWYTSGYNIVLSAADQAVTTQYGTGDLALWDQANAGNGWNGAAPTGNILALDGDYTTGPVYQTVSGLTTGQKYVVNFNYAFAQQVRYYGPTIQNLTVSVGANIWNTNASVTTPDYNLPSQGFSGWVNDSLTFTAASSTQVLSFLAYGNVQVPPFALVSDVSMVAVPNPEAGAGLLMLVVFGGGLAFTRRFSARGKAATSA